MQVTEKIQKLNHTWKSFIYYKKGKPFYFSSKQKYKEKEYKFSDEKIINLNQWFLHLYKKGYQLWNEFFDFTQKENIPIKIVFKNFDFYEGFDFSKYNFFNATFFACNFYTPFKISKQKSLLKFINSSFFEDFSLEKIKFSELQFIQSSFKKSVTFSELEIEEVDFTETRFFHSANFNNTQFTKMVVFPKNIFENADFYCKNVIFLENASFENCSFQKVQLENTHFHQSCSFQNATFFKPANFQEVIFAKKANFSNNHFHQGIIFEKTACLEETIFKQSSFEGESSFENYQGPALLNFSKSRFTNIPKFSYNSITENFLFNDLEFPSVNHTAKWNLDHTINEKITKLKTIVKNGKTNPLSKKKINKTQQKIENKVTFLLLSKNTTFTPSKKKLDIIFQSFSFLLFLPKLLWWQTKKFFSFIWNDNITGKQTFIIPILLLALLFPLFFLIYSILGISSIYCNDSEFQLFILSQYFFFASTIDVFIQLKDSCFPTSFSFSIFFATFLQKSLSFFLVSSLLYHFITRFLSRLNRIKPVLIEVDLASIQALLDKNIHKKKNLEETIKEDKSGENLMEEALIKDNYNSPIINSEKIKKAITKQYPTSKSLIIDEQSAKLKAYILNIIDNQQIFYLSLKKKFSNKWPYIIKGDFLPKEYLQTNQDFSNSTYLEPIYQRSKNSKIIKDADTNLTTTYKSLFSLEIKDSNKEELMEMTTKTIQDTQNIKTNPPAKTSIEQNAISEKVITTKTIQDTQNIKTNPPAKTSIEQNAISEKVITTKTIQDTQNIKTNPPAKTSIEQNATTKKKTTDKKKEEEKLDDDIFYIDLDDE